MISTTLFLAGVLVAVASGARPEVKCPVPLFPVNGQIFMTSSGSSVKYTCNPGFELTGSQIAICKDDQWYPEAPTCEPIASEQKTEEKQFVASTSRPLFKWDDNESPDKTNDTMQSDSAMYVSRAGVNWPYYYRVPLHAADEHGQPTEEALQHYYWASQYQYPRSAVVDYRTGYQLSESQWAWINSLHPELRDQYIKDLHLNGVNYYTYPSGYLNPYYVRQPVAVASEDSISVLDYSCHRTERDGTVVSIKAPRLSNSYIHRYDKRQNHNHPYNHYLVAQYRCKAGYTLLDSRFSELYCSQSTWVGTRPACVPL